MKRALITSLGILILFAVVYYNNGLNPRFTKEIIIMIGCFGFIAFLASIFLLSNWIKRKFKKPKKVE